MASLGYSHLEVIAAVRRQIAKTTFVGLVSSLNQPALDLASRLIRPMPGDFPKKVWLGHWGSDAREAAHRLVLAATGRRRIISFISSWHGMTDSGQTLSGHPAFSSHIGSGHVTKVPYPDPSRNPFEGRLDETVDRLLAYLEGYLFRMIPLASDMAAIFVESVQSDGGDLVPPRDFLPRLREPCDRHDIYPVVDDVKVGLGRTGRFFCYEHAGIEADLVILGKSLGGGLPLSALTGRRVRGLVEAAASTGAYLHARLGDVLGGIRSVREIRGLGLIQGVELVTEDGRPGRPGQPDRTLAAVTVYRA